MKKMEKSIKIVRQDNGAVVFDKSTGIYFQTNDVGVYILECLSKDIDIKSIIEKIVSEFGINIKQAESDVKEFIKSLREVGLY
ncbi:MULTISPECIES: PqqD family protein [Bacillota]|uniref:PqqD family protein n=1 Tax=Bacillota TaxID=1239 RepID=UPI0023F0C3AE|nr:MULTISPECIES: PqqD family protein [Bacillota]MDD7184036.1 PqqD family protein [Peptostreptococcus porci]MDY3050942.1 PqqD family protein [Parvimonas sp.]